MLRQRGQRLCRLIIFRGFALIRDFAFIERRKIYLSHEEALGVLVLLALFLRSSHSNAHADLLADERVIISMVQARPSSSVSGALRRLRRPSHQRSLVVENGSGDAGAPLPEFGVGSTGRLQ